MKMLLNICKNTNLTEKRYEYIFLLLNTLAWCAIGFVVWAVVSIFAFRGTEWMFTSLDISDLFPALSAGLLRPGGMSGNGTFIYIKKGIEYRQR